MVESVMVARLTSKELEPALRRLLGIRAYLSGTGKMGGDDIVHAGSVQIEFIDDDQTDERTIAFTKIPDLLTLVAERREGGYMLRGPNEDPLDRLEQRYRGLIALHEDEVLRHSYRGLVRIPEIELDMRPIANILINVHEYGEYIPTASRSGAKHARQLRVAKYLQLLADMEFIERKGMGFIAGRRLPSGFDEDTPSKEIYEEFLGSVLQSSHQYLTDALHLTMIKPFLRIENSYYWPAHRAGRNIRVLRERFKRSFRQYYEHAPPGYESHLQSMLHRGTLISESGMVSGSEDVLGPLLEQDFDEWLGRQTRLPVVGT